jgi:hypothetical protein
MSRPKFAPMIEVAGRPGDPTLHSGVYTSEACEQEIVRAVRNPLPGQPPQYRADGAIARRLIVSAQGHQA